MKKEDRVDLLRRDLKARRLQSCYLFYGEEEYLKHHYREEIHKLLTHLYGTIERISFADDFTADDFADAVETLPLTASGRLVTLRNIDPAALPKRDAGLVHELLNDLPEGVVVILWYDDTWLAGTSDQRKRREKRISDLAKTAFAVEFPLQSRSALTVWAERRLSAQGLRADEDALEYLLSMSDNKMTALAGELDKLILLCQARGLLLLTKQEVRELALPGSSADMYEIVTAVTAGDFDRALARLDACRRNNERPTAVTTALGNSFCELLYAKAAADAGHSSVDRVMKDFSIRPGKRYFIRQYLMGADRIDRSLPETAVRVLCRTDQLQKSSPADPWLLLEQAIEEIRQVWQRRRG
ncbi:MAG: DNA polymerase III subunit delta [Clostridia bacterium]|nr:DNA polymerase III subunit delta [Clostridia bacterium]